jgi:hypothetical protein
MRKNKSRRATREWANNSCAYETQHNARQSTLPAESDKHYPYDGEQKATQNRIDACFEQSVKKSVQNEEINNDH